MAGTGDTFSFALRDSNLRVERRLFLTATPRLYTSHMQLTDRRRSNDDVSLFGRVVYRLSWAEAVAANIIVPVRLH